MPQPVTVYVSTSANRSTCAARRGENALTCEAVNRYQ